MKNLILGAIILFAGVAASAGSIEGVGLVLSQQDGIVHVNEVLKDTPAERAGIQAQELVLEVNGVSILGMKLEDIVNQIRGPIGTQIALTIADSQNVHERVVQMIRAQINFECFMEGTIFLNFDITQGFPPRFISGTVGTENVQWQVGGSQILGQYKNETLNLDIRGNATNFTIYGYVHSEYIQWNGQNGHVFGTQTCIP